MKLGKLVARPLMLSLILSSLPAMAFTLGGSSSGLMGWPQETLSFKVNTSGCGVDEATLFAAIDDAMAAWNRVPTSGVRLVRGGSTSFTATQFFAATSTTDVPDAPAIVCATDFASVASSDADVVAAVGTYATNSSGQIAYGFLVINAQEDGDARFANLTDAQRRVLLAHEIGHVLGLGHSSESAALMYFSIGRKSELRLHQDDYDGITYLYPRSEPSGSQWMGCGPSASAAERMRPANSPKKVKSERQWGVLLNWLGLALLCGVALRVMRQKQKRETLSSLP